MSMKKTASFLMAMTMALTLCACGTTGTSGSFAATGQSLSQSSTEKTSPVSEDEMFSSRDLDPSYEESTSTVITLEGDSATVEGSGASVSGSQIVISEEGTYLINGQLNDGQIVVDADKTYKVQLVLDNAQITCKSSAAIYVKQADKVFLTLAPGSTNTVCTQGEFVAIDDNNIDSAIFSKEDLTFNGEGSLQVNCENGHGVVSKDDLVIAGGTYQVTAASHGFAGKDSVRIADGALHIVSGKDGIHSENTEDTQLGFIYIIGGTFTIESTGDGMDAGATAEIKGGDFNLSTGGGSVNASVQSNGQTNQQWGNWGGTKGMPKSDMTSSATAQTNNQGMAQTAATSASAATDTQTSAKGIKATGNLTIVAGNFNIDSSDDALHTNGDLYFNAATAKISSGDDGMHADNALVIDSGTIDITKSYEGIEGFTIEINGGDIQVASSDDGMNAAGGNDSSSMNRPGANGFAATDGAYIQITSGNVTIDAGGDGIDSNGTVLVSGGVIAVSINPSGADSALDYDGSAQITGGTLLGTGGSQMAQNFGSNSTQGSILVNLSANQSGEVILKDANGTVLFSSTPSRSYNSVLISIPEIEDGQTYTLSAGSQTTQITMAGLLYGSSNAMGGGAGGGRKQPIQ